MRFASGDLDEAFTVAVAAHIELCEQCRAALRTAESCGGHLLETAEKARVSDDAFDRLRTGIEGNEIDFEQTRTSERASSNDTTSLPKPLHHYVGEQLEDIPWTTIAPGVRKHDITLTSKTANKLYMLHIAAGKDLPEHGHGGSELTLVLSGAYQDHHGRFARGDIADLGEHDEHQPRVDDTGPCICLIASAGQTRPKGLFARLLQPLTGI